MASTTFWQRVGGVVLAGRLGGALRSEGQVLLQQRADLAGELWLSSGQVHCEDFAVWPDIDDGVTCDACTALVETEKHAGRCDWYCESFGHLCSGAAEEESDDCNVKYTVACDQHINGTSDMLCSCFLSTVEQAPAAGPPAATLDCDTFAAWPDIDGGVTCGNCTALVLTGGYSNRCDNYCASFGHECVAAAEEESEECRVKYTTACEEEIGGTSDMLCTCRLPSAPPAAAPVPAPPTAAPTPQSGTLACAAFSSWPSVDGGVTCSNCTALVHTSGYSNRCDVYCASFGHECVAAAEEESDDCRVKSSKSCDEAIAGTSDMLCTCKLPGSPSPPPVVPAPPSEPACVELLVVGDYGTRDSNQRRVAAGMAAVAAERQPAAIAGLGDSIYGSGAEGDPQLIVDWWADVYLQHESLNRPWYIITGNHDWYTDARTERDFTTNALNVGGWWRMPGFWYKQRFEAPGVSVEAFFIDTQVWKGSSVTEQVLGTAARQEQVAWLREALAASTADWKLLFGHHPVFSAGSHGITRELLEELDPLMREHGVQMMFSGHDHSQQLMQYRGFNYIISGAGGASARTRADEYPADSQRMMFEEHGFAGLSVCGAASAELTFYGADGQVEGAATLLNTPPEVDFASGIELANGQVELHVPPAASAQCGGVTLPDVELVCGSGCKVLADNMRGQTCRQYCARSGLSCAGGWEEENDNCVATHDLGCDATHGSTSDLLCECGAPPGGEPRCEQWANQACEGQFGNEDCRSCGTRITQAVAGGLASEVAAQRIADTFFEACGGCGAKGGDTDLQHEGYTQVWSDEFERSGAVDASKWRSVVKGDGFGNNELQFYTDRLENAWVSNGTLKIRAKLEDFRGRRFTSAKLESTRDWKYGKFHVRSRLIGTATGTWAALWMMPTVSHYGGWPHSGEIDIMEHVGYDTGKFHGTVHTGAYHHSIGTQLGGATAVDAHAWHTWTVEWRPDICLFAVNDRVYQIFRNEGGGDTEKWPFDQKFYAILNHAVGGNWGGQRGIDEEAFKGEGQVMEVDWVRVEQRS